MLSMLESLKDMLTNTELEKKKNTFFWAVLKSDGPLIFHQYEHLVKAH